MPFSLPERIIVPVDFSDEAFVAIDAALEIAKTPSQITVVHVLPVLSPMEPGVTWDAVDDEVRTKHLTEALQKKLADPKYQGLQIHVAFGDPGHQITEYAAEVKADLIILPTHGRTGFKRLLLGSVAERVVRLAHCSVLVLRD